MDHHIPEIEELIKQFSKLPGLGPKSAKRIILKLINNKENMVKPLAKSLANVYKSVVRCNNCGNLKLQQNKCICELEKNNYDKICIVENLADMWVIESSDVFKGHFHILGGTINPNENYNQKNLLIDSLSQYKLRNMRNFFSICSCISAPLFLCTLSRSRIPLPRSLANVVSRGKPTQFFYKIICIFCHPIIK